MPVSDFWTRLACRWRIAWAVHRFRSRNQRAEVAALRRLARQPWNDNMPRLPNSLLRPLATRITLDQGRRLDALADRHGVTPSAALRLHLDTLPPPSGDVATVTRRRPPNSTAFHPG